MITKEMIDRAADAIADAGNVPHDITAEQRRMGYDRTDIWFSTKEWHRIAAEMALKAALDGADA